MIYLGFKLLNKFSKFFFKSLINAPPKPRLIELKSEKAIYNRQSQNIVYYDKVKIENKDVLITSDNAEYITKTNLLTLYGNVRVKKNKDYLISDTVIFNTKTKNLKFSMKDKKKKVYGKKTKN